MHKRLQIYNTETLIVEESIHVIFDDKLDFEKSKLVDKLADVEITYSESEGTAAEVQEVKESENDQPEVSNVQTPPKILRQTLSYFEEQILGDNTEPVRTRSHFKPPKEMLLSLVSMIEPISTDEALLD